MDVKESDLDILTYETDEVLGDLPVPRANANKYTRGRLTIIGGSNAYPGAACMASAAADRVGAGYIDVICEDDSVPIVRSYQHSAVVRSWDGFDVSASHLSTFKASHPQACLIGSGFDAAQAIEKDLLFNALKDCVHPLIVDGGAITYLATEDGLAKANERSVTHDHGEPGNEDRNMDQESVDPKHDLIITPHFGEASRLARTAGIEIPAEASDLEDPDMGMALFAKELSEAYKAIVVLKGPKTYIAQSGSNEIYFMPLGTAALAKAGTGDVLAGITSSLSAQGVPGFRACILSTTLHALSARAASARLSEICVSTQDIICFLPVVISSYLRSC